MRLLALSIALLSIVAHCAAIRCYIGSGNSVRTYKDASRPYCSKAYVRCGDSLVSCTSAEISASVYKWAYFHADSLSTQYQNQTTCSTDLCNQLEPLPDGFWCYGGYGYSKENMESYYVLSSSGRSCGIYGTICKSGMNGCTQELINANHVMYYASSYSAYDCESYIYEVSYINFTCCKSNYCAQPPPFKCNYGVSSATGSAISVIDAPFDDTTYSCYSYNIPCNGTDCELGLVRSYYGYAKASTCTSQPSPIKDVVCCNYKQCNTALSCYVGMSAKSAILTTRLMDGYPTKCSIEYRNCSVVQEGCSSDEITLGTTKAYYTYVPGSKCTSRCCYSNGCNSPPALSCYNTSNVFNQSQPDSTKSIEKYDSSDNCARFSYDCSNPLSKKYCTSSEISKSVVKTVYGSATDSECLAAQKDYMNILDPYCCKNALCNSRAAVKASLSCYSGDFASGQGIQKTSYIKLPSAGSYSCYSRTYTCGAVSSTCTQDNVNKKTVRVEYGVTLSCSSLSCCSSDLCNRLDTNPLIEAGSSGGGSPVAYSGSRTTSTKVSDSGVVSVSVSLLLVLTIIPVIIY